MANPPLPLPPSGPTRRPAKRTVVVVLFVFFFFAASWALCIPVPREPPDVWSAFNPDEGSHIRVVRYIATHGTLAPYEYDHYEAMQPPLYHASTALIYCGTAPLLGHESAVIVLRLISCLLGVLTIWLTYQTARLLVPARAALLAAVCVAGVPMFVSLSGAVSNEVLAALTATGALHAAVRGYQRGFNRRRLATLAVWVAAGIGSKMTCVGLLPTAFLALWWAGRRHQVGTGRVAAQMLVVAGVSALAMGWWFVRNAVQYGDPLLQQAHYVMWREASPGFAVLAAREPGLNGLGYAARLSEWGWSSFWGVFDAMRTWQHKHLYLALLVFQGLCLIGMIRWISRGHLTRTRAVASGLIGLFALVVTAVFYRFNWQHFTPQGRYFFPLLFPFGLVTAVGWRALFPRAVRLRAAQAVAGLLLILNLYCLINIGLRPQPHFSAVVPRETNQQQGAPTGAAN